MPRQVRALGIDWGSSSMRFYDLGPEDPLELYAGAVETSKLTGTGTHERVLAEVLERKDIETESIVFSGMITSQHGWVETPYVPTPARLADLAGAAIRRDDHGRRLWFLPGISHASGDGTVDLLRGEETQLAGATTNDQGETTVVLPGTHSKWAQLSAGVVSSFATFVTGELFDLVLNQSSIGLVIDGSDFDAAAFDEGVATSLDRTRRPAGLLHDLFKLRARGVVSPEVRSTLGSRLSGLLIGAELGEALLALDDVGPVRIAGRDSLAASYVRALTMAGVEAVALERDPAPLGLRRIAAQVGALDGV